MAKYLERNQTSGLRTEVPGLVASAGAADAGKIVQTDAAGRLDQTLMPVGIGADTYAGTAAGALTAGDLVFVNSTGGIARASAASGGTEARGFVTASSATGTAATAFFEGRNTALTGLTVGARYFLSDTTAGGITTTPVVGAGKLHQYVGTAVSATSLDFEPDTPIVLA